MKKYNSVFTLSFQVNHFKEDGGDVSLRDLRTAINKKIDEACAEGNPFPIFEGPLDTQQEYPFEDGDVYWSIDFSDDGRPMVNVSVWDDVSAEDYTEDAMVYDSSDDAMLEFIEMFIRGEFPLVRRPDRGAQWVLRWMRDNGFRMPTEVGDCVFLKDLGIAITEWLNR